MSQTKKIHSGCDNWEKLPLKMPMLCLKLFQGFQTVSGWVSAYIHDQGIKCISDLSNNF